MSTMHGAGGSGGRDASGGGGGGGGGGRKNVPPSSKDVDPGSKSATNGLAVTGDKEKGSLPRGRAAPEAAAAVAAASNYADLLCELGPHVAEGRPEVWAKGREAQLIQDSLSRLQTLLDEAQKMSDAATAAELIQKLENLSTK